MKKFYRRDIWAGVWKLNRGPLGEGEQRHVCHWNEGHFPTIIKQSSAYLQYDAQELQTPEVCIKDRKLIIWTLLKKLGLFKS